MIYNIFREITLTSFYNTIKIKINLFMVSRVALISLILNLDFIDL